MRSEGYGTRSVCVCVSVCVSVCLFPLICDPRLGGETAIPTVSVQRGYCFKWGVFPKTALLQTVKSVVCVLLTAEKSAIFVCQRTIICAILTRALFTQLRVRFTRVGRVERRGFRTLVLSLTLAAHAQRGLL